MQQFDACDIAVVGLSGLFPAAANASRFWANILDGVDAIGDPLPQWGGARYLDPHSTALDRLYTQKGGFLRELSRFDPAAFGIMPNSLQGSEPDQYHALTLARDALQDAGLGPGAYDGERTGIILGHGIHIHRANTNGIQHCVVVDQTVDLIAALTPALDAAAAAEVKQLLKQALPPIHADSIPGLVPNVMTGRIANRLGLMGPNYILDAACASSLIAVESAMLELQRGRADLMLAGGINTSTSPLVYMVFCQLAALSRSSRIRPFDASADGTLLGEGGGVLALMRLADARAAGHRIYAVLKAVGQSSDGRGKGVMAPSEDGEALAMRRAYAQCDIHPQTLGLLECHGTGIPLGDRTEIGAMRRIWGTRPGRFPRIGIGSVKSMIGHCIPAAGIASLIKVCLALHHRVLPPTLCAEVNPGLGLDDTPFYVNTETRPWVHPSGGLRRAGVSAFGFGGVNSHAILEEAPTDAEPLCTFQPARRRDGAQLLLFSAPDRADLLRRIDACLADPPADRQALAQRAAQLWRAHDPACGHRLAVVLTHPDQLASRLATAREKLADAGRSKLQTRNGIYFRAAPMPGKVACLFPGENSQYTNMLRDLAVQHPVLRAWLDRLDGLFSQTRAVAPSEAIFPAPTGLDPQARAWLQAQLMAMDLGSESVFSANQGLYRLLAALGLRPDMMLGHSTGEISALAASGVPRLDDAEIGRYIQRMNHIYQRLEDAGAIPPGVLLSAGPVERERVQALVDADDELFLTMDNCRNQMVVFGTEAAIERADAALRAQGAICARLPLSRGYHTPQMAPMADAFHQLFADLPLRDTGIALYSCVEAAPFPPAAERQAFLDTLRAQYVKPVLFRQSIERLYADGARIFIEVGPSSTLSAFVRDILSAREHLVVASNEQARPAQAQLMHLIGRLWVAGVALDPGPLLAADPAPSTPAGAYLPTDLPCLTLAPAQAQALRAHMGLHQPPAAPAQAQPPTQAIPTQAAPAQATAPQPVAPPGTPQPPAAPEPAGPGPAPASTPAVGGADPRSAIAQHFATMDAFLSQQERLMAHWLSRRKQR
ncbi:beta-ketoacyl synthase N-terminal-like domain-containing protein [uncultured Thiohalocapsa sp.]|uniref:type I polyketide synthase n=1 Tax=uncultured Thiohalocapsa sp. TaxID=768990 RepID=UPI002600A20F|nr:beta-ketoacyl synthase N-terminal-like domain-containing protein [uncultured Thiohalocapsa sp.]